MLYLIFRSSFHVLLNIFSSIYDTEHFNPCKVETETEWCESFRKKKIVVFVLGIHLVLPVGYRL